MSSREVCQGSGQAVLAPAVAAPCPVCGHRVPVVAGGLLIDHDRKGRTYA